MARCRKVKLFLSPRIETTCIVLYANSFGEPVGSNFELGAPRPKETLRSKCFSQILPYFSHNFGFISWNPDSSVKLAKYWRGRGNAPCSVSTALRSVIDLLFISYKFVKGFLALTFLLLFFF